MQAASTNIRTMKFLRRLFTPTFMTNTTTQMLMTVKRLMWWNTRAFAGEYVSIGTTQPHFLFDDENWLVVVTTTSIIKKTCPQLGVFSNVSCKGRVIVLVFHRSTRADSEAAESWRRSLHVPQLPPFFRVPSAWLVTTRLCQEKF